MHKDLASGHRFSFQCSSNYLTRAEITEWHCPKGFREAGNVLDCRLPKSIIENHLLKKTKTKQKKLCGRQAAFEFSWVAQPEIPVLAGRVPR